LSPVFPQHIFLFGLAGAGKSYLGRIIAERFAYTPYDLDRDLTPTMIAAVAAGKPFTDAMRDEYFEVVIQRIAELASLHPRLVLMQGAYRERHRSRVQREYPEMQFVWIDAPLALIQQRLSMRGDAISPEYAAVIMKSFEPPPPDAKRLVNDLVAHEDLAKRFECLFRI